MSGGDILDCVNQNDREEMGNGESERELEAGLDSLTGLASAALNRDEILLATEYMKKAIRLVHLVRDSKIKKRYIRNRAILEHYRIGACLGRLGPTYWGRAAAHLNVVVRTFRWRMRAEGSLSGSDELLLCQSLGSMARVLNQRGQHAPALRRTEEALEILFGSAPLKARPSDDVIKMQCYSAQGEAMRGLGYGAEIVIRICEQVFIHYHRYMADLNRRFLRKELLRLSRDKWPWVRDELRPEIEMKRAFALLKDIQGEVSGRTRELADRLVMDQEAWVDAQE